MQPVDGAKVEGAWLTDPHVQDLLGVLNADGEEALVVGGAVRNALLGRPVADVDIATTALPHETIRRIESAGGKAVPTGIEHGTITAVVGHRGVEITTLREDVTTDGRRAVVSFGRSWHADAARRDFTMNALYCDARGAVYDPAGSGLADCQARTVRFIGAPDKRLAEDYLRLLRFFRFYAEYGSGLPDAAGLSACIRARNRLERISAERIGQEIRKLMRAEGAGRACRILAECGLAQPVFARVPNPAVLANFLEAAAAAERPVRFETALAAFVCHGPDDVQPLTARLRLANAERAFLAGLAKLALVDWRDGLPGEQALIDTVIDHGKELAVEALLLAAARLRARVPPGEAQARIASAADLEVPDFPLKGRDLVALGVAAGPEVGAMLAQARRIWRAGGCKAGKDALLQRIRR